MSNIPVRPSGPAPVDRSPAKTLPESIVADVVTQFREAYDARNVDAVLDLFAEVGDWRVGPGTLAGKAAIRRFLEGDARLSPTASCQDSGIGVVVSGNRAVAERLVEQTIEGVRCSYPTLMVYELNEAGRIEHARSYYDRLSILRDVSREYPGIKGWFLRRILGVLLTEAERGLK